MAMSEKTRTVWEFLKANQGADLTAADIAEALGMEKRSVDGIVTSGLQRKGLSVRTETEVQVEDEGKVSHKKVKFITLTDEGLAYDPDAEEE